MNSVEVNYRPINIDLESENILDLYINAGWSAYIEDQDMLFRGLENSLLCLGAYANTELIALIRIIGDAETIIYIQDILVHSDFQRKGIGSHLLSMIKSKYENVRQMVLMTDIESDSVSFYENTGFIQVEEKGLVSFIRRDREQG